MSGTKFFLGGLETQIVLAAPVSLLLGVGSILVSIDPTPISRNTDHLGLCGTEKWAQNIILVYRELCTQPEARLLLWQW